MVAYPSDGANALLREHSDEALAHEYRIFGPPGCGKTEEQRNKIKEYIDAGIDPKDIVVASFTRAAAATLTSRVQGVPKQNIATLHALSYRALGRPEIAEGHLAEWNEYVATDFEMQISQKMGIDPEKDGNVSDEAEGINVNQGLGDETFSQYMLRRAKMEGFADNDRIAIFHARWTAWKREKGYVDYADMIELPRMRQIPLPGNMRVGIFDEFQDFTKSETELVRYWGASMDEYFLSGDDDQTIFAFKGASAENFLYPELPPERVKVLGQSWRVPAKPKVYAEEWIRRLPHRMEKRYKARRDENGNAIMGEVRRLHSEWAHLRGKKYSEPNAGSWRLPGAIVDDVLDRYVSRGKDVMFIASCSYMLTPLISLLRSRGIPFQNKYRLTRRDWNPLKAADGHTGSERILAFLRMRPEVWGDAGARVWTMRDFLLWMEVLDKDKVLNKGVTYKSITTLAEMWENTDPDRLGESLDLVEHLSAWLNPDALDWALSQQDISVFEDHILESKRRGLLFPLNVVKDHPEGARALLSDPKITLGTIHSVKGGEADVVVLFPDITSKQRKDWESGDRDSLRRVFYVGMTRCKESLIIPKPAGYNVPIWQG